METDDLVSILARDAGAGWNSARTLTWSLMLTGVVSMSVAAGLSARFIGVRAHLLEAPNFAPFAYKLASMLALVCGGMLLLLYRAALPGRHLPAILALAPGALLLSFRAVTDPSGYSVMGNSDVSVQSCVISIVGLSIPAVLLLLGVVRTVAPTRPALAGGIAGTLAGTFGAAAYALSCKNDAGSFVLVWYTVAIGITALLGAACGKRVLAW